jgi:transcription elongation factor Elf1
MALVAITVAPSSYDRHAVDVEGARSRSCGQVRRNLEQEKVMAETYSGEFYCVKCKAKREASGEVHVNDKGTRMAKAKCPVCGTNLNRILGRV